MANPKFLKTEKKATRSVRLPDELMKDFKSYAELNNTTQAKLITESVKNMIGKKVVRRKSIPLKDPIYFYIPTSIDLIGHCIQQEKSLIDLDLFNEWDYPNLKQVCITQINNFFDVWDKEEKTYRSRNHIHYPNTEKIHNGILFYIFNNKIRPIWISFIYQEDTVYKINNIYLLDKIEALNHAIDVSNPELTELLDQINENKYINEEHIETVYNFMVEDGNVADEEGKILLKDYTKFITHFKEYQIKNLEKEN